MRADVDSALSKKIRSSFTQSEEFIKAGLTQCASDKRVIAALHSSDPTLQRETFRVLRETGDRTGCSIELRDTTGALTAYSGRPVPGTDSLWKDGGTVFAAQDGPFTVICTGTPVISPQGVRTGTLRASAPLTACIPLNDRFFKDGGIVDRIERELGIELNLDAGPAHALRNDGRYMTIPVIQGGPHTAYVHVQHVTPEAHAQALGGMFDTVMRVLVLMLLIVVSIPAARLYGRSSKHGVYVAAVVLHVWMLRVAVYLSGVERLLPLDDMLNPVYFASPFAWGLVGSPFSLFLTLAALFASLAAIHRHQLRPEVRITMSRIGAAICTTSISIVLPLMIRGFVAAVRSFVSDSSCNYDDVGSVIAQPVLMLMLANTALLAASFTVAIIVFSEYTRVVARTLRARNFFIVSLASLLPTFIVFFAVTDEFLIPWWMYVSAGLVAFVFVLMKGQHIEMRLGSGTGFTVAWVFASIACGMLLSSFMSERRRSDIESMADELARPVDGWSRVLVEQTVTEASLFAAGQPELPQPGAEDVETAFQLWSQTALAAQPNNSAIWISDTAGAILSQFSVGIDPDVREAVQSGQTSGQDSVMEWRFGAARYYSDVRTAESAAGRGIAIHVLLAAIDPLQTGRSTVDIIRNTPQRLSYAPEDQFSVRRLLLRTADSALVLSTGPRMVGSARDLASPAAPDRRGWMSLDLGAGPRDNYVVATGEDGVLLAVAAGESDLLMSSYRICRLGIVFLLTGILLFILTRGHQRKLRAMFPLRFSVRLQLAFLTVSALPVLALWFSARAFLESNAENDLNAQLEERVEVMRHVLSAELADSTRHHSGAARLNDADCHRISAAAGIPLNLYNGTSLVATSIPEFYHTGLLNTRLNAKAYFRLHVLGEDFTTAHERVGAFTYAVGYGVLRDPAGSPAMVFAVPTLFEQSRIEASSIRAFAAIFLFLIVLLAAVVAAGKFLTRQISRPMTRLLNGTRAVAAGDLSISIDESGAPDIGEVVRGFNAMTGQLRNQRTELANYERELAWRDMARQVAHEIRNPLTPLRLAVQHLRRAYFDRREDFDDQMTRMTGMMIDRIDALANISDEFATLARMPHREPVDVDVKALMDECLALFRQHETIQFTLQTGSVVPHVSADRDELSRVFINLLRNAVLAVGDHGHIDISMTSDDSVLEIKVADSGPGIEPGILPRIFEPSFSTRTGGMGLGLAISRRVIDDLGGSITAISEPGEGAVFIVRLPVLDSGDKPA
jgi:signal transduction histidine kinase